MLYGNYCNVGELQKSPKSDGNLPKYDEFIYYFGINFPSRSNYLLSDMWISMIFSIITVLALIFFIYAIFVILRQKRLSELQSDFINNMTHEFKTPISSIKISSDMFLSTPLVTNNPKLKQYAEIIRQQNLRLDDQVEKVLNIAKLDDEEFKIKPELINFHDIVREIIMSKELEIKKRSGHIEYSPEDKIAYIRADKLHLTNVLFNLLDNAIKYSVGAPDIKMHAITEGNSLVFTIIDKGIGISKEHQKHLFKKFFRVPTGNVHNVKGFGLGLHYVKRIADRHKWKIRIQSELNKGTEVSMIMPLEQKSGKE
jgi:two-component system phosphate regulon sensor histidine kinase PhoR